MSEKRKTRPPALTSSPPRRILFLCVHNSARSQIAEAIARSRIPGGGEVWSAGSRPTRVNPLAVEVMKEIGFDISAQRAKSIDEVPWREADTVIILCGESESECPTLAAPVRLIHWPLPDPAQAPPEEREQAFRETRDQIRWRISSLWPGGD
jgi:thioredoxin type arsenate reductase